MSLKRTLSLSLLLLAGFTLFAVNENAGTTGFSNLQVMYSARAMGMAKAMTGMDGTIEGLQFNPAAILNVDNKMVASTFSSYFVGSNGGAVHFLLPRSEQVTYGFMAHYLNFGEIDRTEVTQNNEYLETGETFGASNIILGATASRQMNPSIDVGATLKFIYDKIDSYSATAIAVDAGLIHHPANEKIKVGLSVRNLGTQVSYYTAEKYSEKLPFTFGAGLSYQVNPKLLGAIDISKPSGSDVSAKFGFEYQLHQMLIGRAGFNSNSADWKTGGDWDWSSGFSFGAGFNWKNYVLDYGVASYGNLGFVNQLTLKYNF
jgi:hypothetical protein